MNRIRFKILVCYCVLIYSFVITLLPAQEMSSIVKQIVVNGNQVTREFVIKREIQHSVGVAFDSTIAEEDRDRIDNLGIFSDVKFFLSPADGDSVVLTYQVVETFRILPLPIVMYQEATGWSYGALMLIKNFRGRNEMLQIYGAGGGNGFGGILFNDPWIMGDHVSLQTGVSYNTYTHTFLPFVYSEFNSELTIGRYFGYNWKIWGSISLNKRWMNYLNDEPNIEHDYFQSRIKLIYDTRDLYIDPSHGVLIFTEIRPDIGLNDSSPNNILWETQSSIYKLLLPGAKRWVGGASVYLLKYFGEEIPYRVMSVGGAESVRGWSVVDSLTYGDNMYRTGLNRYYASLEVRHTIIPKHLTKYGTESGLIITGFIDIGATDNNFFQMFSKKPIIGVGVGTLFYIPGNILFRIDYGDGFYNGRWQNPQWHISAGHKF